MRRVVCLLGLLLLTGAAASAQGNTKVDIFAGYSYLHTGPGVSSAAFNANGGVGSVAFNFNGWGSFVAEVGGIHASHIGGANVDASAETFLFGPKVSLFRNSRLTPFGQVLFGFAHTNAAFNGTTGTNNGLAISGGAGLDWNLSHHLGIRLGQVDYLFNRVPTATSQVNWNNFRYSAGVVIRF